MTTAPWAKCQVISFYEDFIEYTRLRMYSRKHSHYTINIYKILFTFDQQDIKSGNKICGNDDILPQQYSHAHHSQLISSLSQTTRLQAYRVFLHNQSKDTKPVNRTEDVSQHFPNRNGSHICRNYK